MSAAGRRFAVEVAVEVVLAGGSLAEAVGSRAAGAPAPGAEAAVASCAAALAAASSAEALLALVPRWLRAVAWARSLPGCRRLVWLAEEAVVFGREAALAGRVPAARAAFLVALAEVASLAALAAAQAVGSDTPPPISPELKRAARSVTDDVVAAAADHEWLQVQREERTWFKRQEATIAAHEADRTIARRVGDRPTPALRKAGSADERRLRFVRAYNATH